MARSKTHFFTKQEAARSIDSRLQLERLAFLTTWFALVTGLAEVFIRAIQKFWLKEQIFLSLHVAWMAPLADMLIFGLFSLVLLIGSRLWPRLISAPAVTFVFAYLAFFGPLFTSRLHTLAALLLTAGLAAQTSRFITAHLHGFYSLVDSTTGWLLAIVAAVVVAVYGWQFFVERSALAKLPTPSSGSPNVLLIVLDTVRAQNLSIYDHSRQKQLQLERIAKQGVVFQRALSTSPWTLPSHASMFTGRFPHELSADWKKPLDAQYPTLAEAFSSQGYLTAGFVANLLYCSKEQGLSRGFVHYEDYPTSVAMMLKSSWLARIITLNVRRIVGYRQELVSKNAAELNRDFLRWLDHKNEKPFFAFLNYYDAHEPYLPPAPFDSESRPTRVYPDLSAPRSWSALEIEDEMHAYDGTIAYLDTQIGQLFDELRQRGLLENTLVIITSDHGEHFGEHNLFYHGNSLYRPLLHVPLFISFPSRIPAGKYVPEAVTLRDIPATVLDIVGLKSSHSFPGSSLARHWDTSRGVDDPPSPLVSGVSKGINMAQWLPVSKGDMKSLVADGLHYIRNGDGREELYDFENDVLEEKDLAGTEEGRRALERFRKYLDTSPRSNQALTHKQELR